MRKLALALAATATLALGLPASPAAASIETAEAKATAASAADIAREDMFVTFGTTELKPGRFLWKNGAEPGQVTRVVISLGDQLAFAYHHDELIAVSTISSGTEKNPTPTGIFNVLEKKPMHRSRKYENAPMPFMQRIDQFGVALHAGHLPGYPASHGCIRLPHKFAAKLYQVTRVGTPVLIGA